MDIAAQANAFQQQFSSTIISALLTQISSQLDTINQNLISINNQLIACATACGTYIIFEK